MMHKSVHALLIAVALLSSLTVAAYAQTGSQGVVGSPLGGSSGHGAPSASRGGGATVLSEDFVRMKLAPGFLVGLNILDDPDFTGSFRIDEQGDIAVPTLGTLHVAGETVSEARTQIRKKLIEDKILKDPQVDLNVQEYAAPEVTIIGEVGSPGKYTLLASRNLVDVLALAGGPTPAAGSTVEITHGSAGGQPTLIHYSRASSPRAVEDVFVNPGDTVRVLRAGIVYALGAVTRPGGYVMLEEGSLSLLQLMSMAGGTTVTAAPKTVYVLHRNADGAVEYIALPYKKMTHGKSTDIQLHATDIVYVPTSTIKSIYANTQQIINSAATSAIYFGVGTL